MSDRIKVSELVVGTACNLPLIVKKAISKVTKTQKPYLFLELYDGHETIVGNYWDWAGNAMPDKNAILNVIGKVDEYMGKKQINVRALTTNQELTVADFMPASGYDIGEVYKSAYSFLSDVPNNTLRDVALGLLEDEAERWLAAPAATTVHHAFVGGTLVHCLATARIAKAIAEVTDGADVSLCMVGGFLHDIGKLYAYQIDGVSIEMTSIAKLMEHTFLGARKIDDWCGKNIHLDKLNYMAVELLMHVVLSHHGRQEYGAATPPLCIESIIVSNADEIDSMSEQVRTASKDLQTKWTDKIYFAGNKPFLTVDYVQHATVNKP